MADCGCRIEWRESDKYYTEMEYVEHGGIGATFPVGKRRCDPDPYFVHCSRHSEENVAMLEAAELQRVLYYEEIMRENTQLREALKKVVGTSDPQSPSNSDLDIRRRLEAIHFGCLAALREDGK